MALKFNSSVIICEDIREQREFYEKFLGQKVVLDHGNYVVFENGFAIWKLDEKFPITRELGYSYEYIGNRNFELSFETDHFEEEVEKVLMSDLRILHNVEEEPWGQYTIRFYDPEGNLVEIGESAPCFIRRMKDSGMTPEQIEERTGMDKQVVNDLLQG